MTSSMVSMARATVLAPRSRRLLLDALRPPAGYRLWPLWYVSLAFVHGRLAGGLFVLGLLANAVLGL